MAWKKMRESSCDELRYAEHQAPKWYQEEAQYLS